jgi:Leucine-rich repeat (LRR) protein
MSLEGLYTAELPEI